MAKVRSLSKDGILDKELNLKGWFSFVPILAQIADQQRPEYVLEWGPGMSTKTIIQHSPNSKILTIEHQRHWYDIAKSQFGSNPNVEIVHRALTLRSGDSEGYVNYPLYRAITEGYDTKRYDLVFVDGRCRFDCLVTAFLMAKDSATVVIHDSQRINYHPAIEMFPHYKFFDNLCTAVMSKEPLLEITV